MFDLALHRAALAAALTVTAAAPAALAQDASAPHGQTQSLEQLKQARKAEENQQGGRMIQVREKAVYGLSDVAQERIFDAMRHLVEEPSKAKTDLLVIADVIELQAAAGGEQAMRQGQQSAEPIRDAARRLEFKQLVTKQELQRTLGQAALSLAQIQYQGARQGAERQDQEQLGYPLASAAEFLSTAHTLLEKQPSEQVSRAIYDAETLGKQVVKLSRPTTGQGYGQSAGRNADQTGDLANAQPAAGQVGGQQQSLPAEARRVVEQFGQALQQVQSSVPTQQQQQQ